ncbi:MAG: endolytic transglycosylase MltG [Spirochaetaceae bacterium]|jgi:UPF0755 protein|nr:endolytic transglycosylase MltG [Spirochaetaceae bacterium]
MNKKINMKKVCVIFLSIVFIGIAAAAAGTLAAFRLNEPPAEEPRSAAGIVVSVDSAGIAGNDGNAGIAGIARTSALVEISEGESAISAGRRLERSGIIRSALFWELLTRIKKEYIKTGTYKISLPATTVSIYRKLISGDEILVSVTIPEGSTLKKTAALWEKAGICGEEDFIAAAGRADLLDKYRIDSPTMEGYLYPDTYHVPPAYPAEKIIMLMADTFFKRLESFGIDVTSMRPAELRQTVILASIVEREYRAAEEAPVIAGVFRNRMEIGMRLESCATVEYVITEILGRPHPTRLWDRDTRIENPYNTYVNRGLPPGPIASPGEVALQAAFAPQKSDYLFFRLVNADAGTHYFSRTFDDHIKAALLYVKG